MYIVYDLFYVVEILLIIISMGCFALLLLNLAISFLIQFSVKIYKTLIKRVWIGKI